MTNKINNKGQGLTEYGIILLLVLLVGCGVWFNYDVKGNISTMYSAISMNLKSIADNETTENYDTGVTKKIGTTTLHKTSLSIFGTPIYWYIPESGFRKGIKQYTYTNLDPNDMTVNKASAGYNPGKYQYISADGSSLVSFFKADDGNIYQMTSDGATNNTITKFTGEIPSVNMKQIINSGTATGTAKVLGVN